MASFIEFENVNFSYRADTPLLKNISLKVEKGEFIAVMGGSGCGKTTLLRLITAQIQPNSGRILIEGKDLKTFTREELFAFRKKMGVLFQFGALFTDLSVYDNVAFPLREHTQLPESLIRNLVLLKLDAVGLRGTESLMPSQLSGGMARRIALARTIALDPQILLFDEPFTGLDPISLGVISHLIASTNKSMGATSLMVTHDIQKSLDIVDRVLFLSDSEVIFHGTPQQMRALDSPWIKQFINGEAEGPVAYRFNTPKTLEQDLLDTNRK